jgi:hypothetical protein
MKSLTVISVQLYISEIADLLASLSSRFVELENASQRWRNHESIAVEQLAALPNAFREASFAEALVGKANEQSHVFHSLDGLLACWARLSLLLFPAHDNSDAGKWAKTRGKTLRQLLDIPSDSLLANRDVRDSWMHFDERLDHAVQEGRLGNRQTMCSSASAASAMDCSVRVIDMERLVLHYRKRDGAVQCICVRDMKACLYALEECLKSARGSASEIVERYWSTQDDPGSAENMS